MVVVYGQNVTRDKRTFRSEKANIQQRVSSCGAAYYHNIPIITKWSIAGYASGIERNTTMLICLLRHLSSYCLIQLVYTIISVARYFATQLVCY